MCRGGAIERMTSPTVANQTLAAASAIFSWAIAEEIGGVKNDPCSKMARHKLKSRERVLSRLRASSGLERIRLGRCAARPPHGSRPPRRGLHRRTVIRGVNAMASASHRASRLRGAWRLNVQRRATAPGVQAVGSRWTAQPARTVGSEPSRARRRANGRCSALASRPRSGTARRTHRRQAPCSRSQAR